MSFDMVLSSTVQSEKYDQIKRNETKRRRRQNLINSHEEVLEQNVLI